LIPGAPPRWIRITTGSARWLAAPGQRAVDFEERVNFRRLHDYRLARARQALGHSGLGAMLCFDTNNIRYLTSTVIGEWARDKMIRFALLAGDAEPYFWDFGSAVKHHQLYSPWLPRPLAGRDAGGTRGDTPESGLMRMHAQEINRCSRNTGSNGCRWALTWWNRRCSLSCSARASRFAIVSK
jgi:hypothetical protein